MIGDLNIADAFNETASQGNTALNDRFVMIDIFRKWLASMNCEEILGTPLWKRRVNPGSIDILNKTE